MPHWVKDEVDTFSPGHFRCGYKIRVAGDEHNLIDLLLERERCHVYTNSHVDAFLACFDADVVFGQVCNLDDSFQELSDFRRFDCPLHIF